MNLWKRLNYLDEPPGTTSTNLWEDSRAHARADAVYLSKALVFWPVTTGKEGQRQGCRSDPGDWSTVIIAKQNAQHGQLMSVGYASCDLVFLRKQTCPKMAFHHFITRQSLVNLYIVIAVCVHRCAQLHICFWCGVAGEGQREREGKAGSCSDQSFYSNDTPVKCWMSCQTERGYTLVGLLFGFYLRPC